MHAGLQILQTLQILQKNNLNVTISKMLFRVNKMGRYFILATKIYKK